MKRPTKEQLKALYEAHVRRYEGRLVKARAGLPGCRVSELTQLLKLWREVALHDFDLDAISDEAREEVEDALADQDDGLSLGRAELTLERPSFGLELKGISYGKDPSDG
jgi:hypothetical protein